MPATIHYQQYIQEYNAWFKVIFKEFSWYGPFKKSLLNLLQYCFYFGFLAIRHVGILAPWAGTEPAPPTLEGKVLTTGLSHNQGSP